MRIGRGIAVIILAVVALSMVPMVAFAQTSPDPTATTPDGHPEPNARSDGDPRPDGPAEPERQPDDGPVALG